MPRSRCSAASATERASPGSSTAARWRPSSTGGSPRRSGCSGASRPCSRTRATSCGSSRPARPAGTAWSFAPSPGRGWWRRRRRVQLARDLGAPEGQAYALWHRSEALSALGRHAEAEADAREALTVAGDGRAPRVDRDRLARARHRAAGAAAARRGRRGVRGVRADRGGDVDAVRLVGRRPVRARRGRARAARRCRAVGASAHWPSGRRWDTTRHGGPQVELAAARGADDCTALAAAAWHRAGAGGHLASVPRLAELAGRS